jgi:hypothetical protein
MESSRLKARLQREGPEPPANSDAPTTEAPITDAPKTNAPMAQGKPQSIEEKIGLTWFTRISMHHVASGIG